MKTKRLTIAQLTFNVVEKTLQKYDTITVQRNFRYDGDTLPEYVINLYHVHTYTNYPGSRVGYSIISKRND